MDDEKIKLYFSDYQPEIPSDRTFMNNLEINLESVEIIKRHADGVRTKHRIALGLSALSGFTVGCLLSLLFPYIRNFVAQLQLAGIEIAATDNLMSNYSMIPVWLITGGLVVITALYTYDLSLAILKVRTESKRGRVSQISGYLRR